MKQIMLIVDDSKINRAILARIFEDEYMIITAESGHTALTLINYYGAKISIILLDIVMPGMDGFEVLNAMRENPEVRSIPVIVVSGQADIQTGLKAIRSGATDFIFKPVDANLIKLRVESAICRAENSRLRAENDYYLKQSGEEAKYRAVLDSTGTVVIEYDRLATAFKYDPSISKYIAGKYDERRLWQIMMSDMVADISDVKAMQQLVYATAGDAGGKSEMKVRLLTPSGKKQWFRMRVFNRLGETERARNMILTFNNINDEVESAEKLRYQAQRDELTGVYNRTAFFEKAGEMIHAHEAGHYILAGFDIEKFKVINDQYGSDKGDEILKFIANTFRENFEPVGGIVGRIMADNFAVLYPASLTGSKLLTDVHFTVSVLDGTTHPIAFSVGRYLVDDLKLSVSAMYDRAAITEASVKGRYDVHIAQYDESMRDMLLSEQEIVIEMKPALESGQFEIWLQPQYNHSTRALIGAEALVRWRHPKKGIVPPGSFIPVFERNGFIYEVDKYVWEMACALIRKWLDAGLKPLPVSVNISRTDLYHENLAETLAKFIKRYDISADMLRLEITESAFAESAEQVVRVVKNLIEHGFTVEIDDFGSGYSSLNTLKDVPAQVLKLDMRFLDNSENSDRSGNVLESVVRMAKWLGMAVIAEGVETIEQANYLKSIGCTYVQGYLYARPMPTGEYETLFGTAGKERKLLALETVKNLDNNAFWNPKSIDTLIFNSYVGAACIMEYSGDKVELLRISDKFMQILGSETMSVEDALKLDWKRHYSEESARALNAAFNKSMRTGEDVTGEYLFLNLPGCPEKTYMRITLRVIASSGNSYLIYCLNENITSQKQLEEKERASVEQLQAIMANINGGVNMSIIRDGMPRVQFANEQYYKMRGYTKAQYDAEVANVGEFIHPDDRQMMLSATSEADKPFSIMYRIIRRDGEVRWLINNVTFVRLPGYDEPVQLSVTNDITDMRQAQEKERKADEQLQAIMANIHGSVTAMVVRDGALVFLFANEQFYKMQGYTRAQYEAEIGNTHSAVHPDDRERLMREIRRASADGMPFSTVYRVIRRDGAVRWFLSNIALINLPDVPEPVQLSVSSDITETREAERKEYEISERLRAIMRALNCGVSCVTMNDDGVKYIFANDKYYTMLGYTRKEFEAEVKSGLKRIHPDDWQRTEKRLKQLIESGGSALFEFRVIRRDGEIRHFRVNASILTLDGVDAPVCLGVSDDVTDMVNARHRITELSELMHAILENIDGGITATEISGEQVGYLFANDRFFELHGYTKAQYDAEIISVFDLVHPDDRQKVLDAVAYVNEIGKNTVIEYRVIRRDGCERRLRTTITARAFADAARAVLFSVYVDITE